MRRGSAYFAEIFVLYPRHRHHCISLTVVFRFYLFFYQIGCDGLCSTKNIHEKQVVRTYIYETFLSGITTCSSSSLICLNLIKCSLKMIRASVRPKPEHKVFFSRTGFIQKFCKHEWKGQVGLCLWKIQIT